MAAARNFFSANLADRPDWLRAWSRRASPFRRGAARLGRACGLRGGAVVSAGTCSGVPDPKSSNIVSFPDFGSS